MEVICNPLTYSLLCREGGGGGGLKPCSSGVIYMTHTRELKDYYLNNLFVKEIIFFKTKTHCNVKWCFGGGGGIQLKSKSFKN